MLTEKKSTPRSPSAAPRRKTPAARRERAPEWDEARLTQKRIKRNAILQVARRALHENGYHGTSLGDIAKKLGMTDAALYYYFKNKAELASVSVLDSHKHVAGWLNDAANEGETGLARVEAFVRHAASNIAQQKIWIPSTEPTWLAAAFVPEVRKLGRDNLKQLAGFISQGIEDKTITWCEPNSTAALISGFLFFMRGWAPFANMLGAPPGGLGETISYFVSSALARGNLTAITNSNLPEKGAKNEH